MPYPFTNSPLNSYLPKLRSLLALKKKFSAILENGKISAETRYCTLEKHNKVLSNIEKIKSQYPIEPRSEMVFKNKAQLAITRFEIENPPPFIIKNCTHDNKNLCVKKHSDNTLHIVEQCQRCGRAMNPKKKNTVRNWTELPYFNEKIYQQEFQRCKKFSQWNDKRYQIYRNHIIESNIPEIDYAPLEDFEQENPRPLTRNTCQHKNTTITLRKYSQNNQAVVKQCNDCGQHIFSIKKSQVSNYSKLSAFDEDREKKNREKYTAWLAQREQYKEKLEAEYIEKIKQGIETGELKYIKKDTFNTYYDSKEWHWARNIILKRDGQTCQACGSEAECVHHITYERLGEESSLDLISLCNQCHDKIHHIQNQYHYSFRMTPNEIKSVDDFIHPTIRTIP